MTSPKRICHILEMNTQHLLCMRKRINQTNNNPWCKTCQVYHMNRWSVCIQSWGQHSVSANEWERVSGDQADYQEIYACRFLLLGLPTVCTTARNLQRPKWDNHLYQIYNFPMMFTSRYGWCKQLGGQGAAQDRDVPHTDVMWMSCWWRSYVSLQRCKREEKIKYQKNKKNHEISKKLFHKDRRRSDAPTGLSWPHHWIRCKASAAASFSSPQMTRVPVAHCAMQLFTWYLVTLRQVALFHTRMHVCIQYIIYYMQMI